MHIDGPIRRHQRLPYSFEAADQELCLGTDAIGEIIESIIREIKYRVAHESRVPTGIFYTFGGVNRCELASSRMSVILRSEESNGSPAHAAKQPGLQSWIRWVGAQPD